MPFRHRLLALVASSLLTGCTLLGLGTGVTVDALAGPSYDEQPAHAARPLTRGELVRARTSRGLRVEGRYFGMKPPNARDPEAYLVLREEDGNQIELRYSEVTRIGVEKPGRGWMYGALVGLSIDIAAVVALSQTSVGDGWDYGESWN